MLHISETSNNPADESGIAQTGQVLPIFAVQRDGIDPSMPMVALTFDDGPSEYTLQILDILEQHNVRATFFVVGNRLASWSDTVRRAHSQGNEIIGHSWDHSDMTRLSESEIMSQLLNTNAAINSITGTAPNFFRPPYGAVNNQLRRVSAELGFAIVNWSVDPADWRDRCSDRIYSDIIHRVRNKDIILCHDVYDTTVNAVERLIPELIAQGYQLVTVSELLSFTHDTLDAGRIYLNG
jgi:peptidoglycan/xylan/chitin deacetylase (PgdA/CDA1 family)